MRHVHPGEGDGGDRVPARVDLDQSFGQQLPERLPDRHPADAEVVRQLVDPQFCPGQELPQHDAPGGLAGASSLLGAGAQLTDGPALARAAKTGAFGGISLSLAETAAVSAVTGTLPRIGQRRQPAC
ncbi:hypothetical protein GCM10017788_39040 [Amycolatopsis acidiphila]|nr:hypothetical protein GCM10017788_39040 [Amycolatopsis acidiphila]